ncbi:MAG: hypothetical protein ABI644_00715 [Arenimonas sp.]
MPGNMQRQGSSESQTGQQTKNNGSVFLGFTLSVFILGGGYGLIYFLNRVHADSGTSLLTHGPSKFLLAIPAFVFIVVCGWLINQKRGRSLMGMMIGVALAGLLFVAMLVLLMAACFGLL